MLGKADWPEQEGSTDHAYKVYVVPNHPWGQENIFTQHVVTSPLTIAQTQIGFILLRSARYTDMSNTAPTIMRFEARGCPHMHMS